ncbi:MAG: 30S ribosomal protein S4 [Dehalococcoidia bacterium]|nr:30S ribosomal protein S4 [Dehalococcoidia bacterium]
MARYTGPKCRLCRRAGEKLFLKGERCLTPKCAVEKRTGPPGDHGMARRRRVSEHGLRMREKNRAKAIYGVLERQFRKYFEVASRKPGQTGQYLLQILERRLDSTLFRLGFAESRAQARQVVRHGQITVNGKKLNIPSYQVEVGDVIGWTDHAKKSKYYKALTEDIHRKPMPKWLTMDAQAVTGKVESLPQPSDMDLKIEDRMIVEYYAR